MLVEREEGCFYLLQKISCKKEHSKNLKVGWGDNGAQKRGMGNILQVNCLSGSGSKDTTSMKLSSTTSTSDGHFLLSTLCHSLCFLREYVSPVAWSVHISVEVFYPMLSWSFQGPGFICSPSLCPWAWCVLKEHLLNKVTSYCFYECSDGLSSSTQPCLYFVQDLVLFIELYRGGHGWLLDIGGRSKEVANSPPWERNRSLGFEDLYSGSPWATVNGCFSLSFRKSLTLQNLYSTNKFVVSVYLTICASQLLFFLRQEADEYSPIAQTLGAHQKWSPLENETYSRAVCLVACFPVPSRSLQEEWTHLSILRVLDLKHPLTSLGKWLLICIHGGGVEKGNDTNVLGSVVIMAGRCLHRKTEPQRAWVDRQQAYCRDDPEVLVQRNDHSVDMTDLINGSSEMRCTIPCQRGGGQRRKKSRNIWLCTCWNYGCVELGKGWRMYVCGGCLDMWLNLFIDTYLMS